MPKPNSLGDFTALRGELDTAAFLDNSESIASKPPQSHGHGGRRDFQPPDQGRCDNGLTIRFGFCDRFEVVFFGDCRFHLWLLHLNSGEGLLTPTKRALTCRCRCWYFPM